MAAESPIWAQNVSYSARLDRQFIDTVFTEGVISGLEVTQRGAGANMSVDVAPGRASIVGDDQASQGSYIAIITSTENVIIGAAPGANSRIDLVYLRINDPGAGGPAGNTATVGVVAGTAAASPVPPALPTSAIPLAHVLVNVGNASVLNSMITSKRVASLVPGATPPGTIIDYVGATEPSGWLFPDGRAVSRSTYWQLFTAIGTTFGAGDGSTTFNLPDLRGRVGVAADNMGGTDAGRLSSVNTIGTAGGAETVTLSTANLPSHSHSIDHDHAAVTSSGRSAAHTHGFSGTTSSPGNHVHGPGASVFVVQDAVGGGSVATSAGPWTATNTSTTAAAGDHSHTYSGNTGTESADHTHTVDLPTFSGNSGNQGSGTAVNNMQPFLTVNKLIRAN